MAGGEKSASAQAIVKQIVNKVAKGDRRAAKLLLELPQETGSPTEIVIDGKPLLFLTFVYHHLHLFTSSRFLLS
jgi:hypothetical protein